ncbi:MAG: ABC transporter ATP-binding protein [Candidatus Dormibacteria bacterium]
MTGNAIEVTNLSKRFRIPLDRSSSLKYRLTHPRSTSRYRALEALRDVSFNVPAGQFLGIIGHNGSGKSTLLKVLSRIYEPDRGGRVQINGDISPFLELGVGFNPDLTVRENIGLNGAILGISRREIQRRMKAIMDFASKGIEPIAPEQRLKNLSSGQQVRVAFAVAIQADAPILLMDEVLAVGDAAFQQECFDTFAAYKREGRTVILVTHELGSVNLYCDRALLLDHGSLIADGPAGEVTALYQRRVGAATLDITGEALADVERWGSAEVSVTTVRLLDAAGKEHTVVKSGDAIAIEVDYIINHEAVTDFTCTLQLSRSDGMTLAQPSTALSQYAAPGLGQRGARGTIRYAIESLPLLAAAYTISVDLSERRGSNAYDHLERVINVTVIDELSRDGLLDLSGIWSVDKHAAQPQRERATPAP